MREQRADMRDTSEGEWGTGGSAEERGLSDIKDKTALKSDDEEFF